MHQPSARRRTRLLALAGAGAVIAPLALVAPSAWANPDLTVNEDGTYIVMLADSSLAAYDGGVQGIPATKPAEGEKLSTTTAAAEDYTAYLDRQQNAVLDSVGLDRADAVYTYSTAFNGFTADLTGSQVSALRKDPKVAAVWENEVRYTDTITTPDYLGLTGDDGVWNTQFGGDANAGSGIVVGIIDTGFWPENPSFAALPGDPEPPADWNGECVEGDSADPADNVTCNSKVIGARFYPDTNDTSFDFESPRDTNGHGSHVGGTSAGNVDVPMEINGVELGEGSGMAPAAHLAFYKALWQTEDGNGSGTSAGLVAAIDDAVADGVDVINYSVSGSSDYVVTADELAFLDAANAGVFVSTSAGNSGDTVGESSVAHNSPWTMTVAASTHDRTNSAEVELGGGAPVTRISGTNRYDTAAQIAAAYPEGVDTVYIATGNQFADALSGAAAASQGLVPANGLDQPAVAPDGSPAPVLLTKVDEIPSATMEALESIDPDNIVVLGGEVAVSDDVEDALGDYGTVTRVAGANRYETAALVAEQYGEVDHVYVATGQDEAFPDALSGSALAGSEGVPVLLTKSDMVPGAVSDALEAMGDPEVHVIGGSAAVSEDVFEDLGGSERLSGTDRYGTSVAVAEQFGYDADNPAPVVHTATGRDYPDALAGSALAGFQGVPVVLSRPDGLPNVVRDGMVALAPESAVILGGEGALNDDVRTEIEALFEDSSQTYPGISSGMGVGPAPLVNSVDIVAADSTVADAELCLPGSLDAAGAADNIVICTRGTNARVEKSETVAEAGGIGMVLANNNNEESLNGDFHSVPTIHVDGTTGDAIKAYEASDPNPTATISATGEGPELTYPEMAGFSSYGPASAGGGDLLKPDITAPGVDVIAAVSPAGNGGNNFDSYSGTSMSAPHIAGLAALMMQDNPEWSPMAVKSSMMTTADPTNSEGELINYAGAPASPLHYGSGEVEPGAAYGTPLVYDSDVIDWIGYACSIGQWQLIGGAADCADLGESDPSDLNYPSIAIGDLGGTQTITRTVTDASGEGGTFTAEVEAPPGIDAVVEPSTITVEPGGTATFEVTFTTTDAELGEWTFGSLTWTGPGEDVRSPIAINPVAMGAPAEIRGEGTEGSETFEVTPGFSGELTSVVHGLMASDVTDLDVTSDGPAGGDGIADAVVPVTVPEGTSAIRVEVVESEWTPDGLDLDLYLADSEGNVVGQSAAGGSDESVTTVAPAPGDYLVAIDFWSGAEGEVASGPLHVFMPSADEGNMTVTPSPVAVTAGVPLDLTAAWTGLDAATRYLGVIGYSTGGEEVASTLVSVNTP
ncbi:N-acetylmuramoyl-L-alanine amidase [Serinicoccus hydrothermalis]|uniref:N-acetylmuramoyl-L-alanine amidase n=1 Tax=Serinicoccus hydrothermalis TaxID=1758689 RepID=A0A1B1NAV0_9MICO|nr:cell wall-binding repeat-containing protein [Serinicoccus hydrothermalis]ANS78541.1 N-acetylmuramoyl-L-alanine amidase [Serinicoccus hydrothermalis]